MQSQQDCHEPCHQSINDDSSSSIAMTSPASMPSELKGAVRNSNHPNCHAPSHPSSLSQDELFFLENLKDVLNAVKALEASYERGQLRKQRKQHTSNNSDLPPFYDSWRPVMISWMYHVADTFRLMPIVVATGIYILDTCSRDLWDNASSTKIDPRDVYPLMTMTALNMGVKCHETKMFPLDQLCLLLGPGGSCSSSNPYTPQDIIEMERKLLHKCGWKLHKPTTHDYLLRYVELLAESQRDAVVAAAILHLKRSLLWEHEAHKHLQHHTFSSCTLAYAAFLVAMEDAGLPLADKQAACMALLEVANLSAQTPLLSEAYNWLLQARDLQIQLEQNNNAKLKNTPVPQQTVVHQTAPGHTPEPVVQQQPAVDLFDDVSCDTSIATSKTCSQQEAEQLALSFIEDPQAGQTSSTSTTKDGPVLIEQNEVYEDECSTSLTSQCSSTTSEEVIFCSYSSDGDAFEVIVAHPALEGAYVDEDDQSTDQSVNTISVLPTVLEEGDDEEEGESVPLRNFVEDESEDDDSEYEEEEVATLVLTESLDEDGFEVAFQSKHHAERLASFMASPREVFATDLSY